MKIRIDDGKPARSNIYRMPMPAQKPFIPRTYSPTGLSFPHST
jgi:hypothetical protein